MLFFLVSNVSNSHGVPKTSIFLNLSFSYLKHVGFSLLLASMTLVKSPIFNKFTFMNSCFHTSRRAGLAGD